MVRNGLAAIEVKAGATVSPSALKNLLKFRDLARDESLKLVLVHGGDQTFESRGVRLVNWKQVDSVLG